MDLDKKFELIEQFKEEQTDTIGKFKTLLTEKLREILSSAREIDISVDTTNLGKILSIKYENKERKKVFVSLEIDVYGFSSTGKVGKKEGLTLHYKSIVKHPNVKPLKKVRKSSSEILDIIVSFFKNNVKGLTTFDDVTGVEEFTDANEDGGTGAVAGTATGDIAIHKVPLGDKDDEKIIEK